jgi:hypothetical protein
VLFPRGPSINLRNRSNSAWLAPGFLFIVLWITDTGLDMGFEVKSYHNLSITNADKVVDGQLDGEPDKSLRLAYETILVLTRESRPSFCKTFSPA